MTDYEKWEITIMDAPFPDTLVADWQEFLSQPRTLDDLFANRLLFPLQRRREMEKMFGVVGKLHWTGTGTYMEIGADKGGGLWAWLTAYPASIKRVIACEIRGTPYSDLFERAFPHVKFLWLPQSSQDRTAVDCTRSWVGRDKIDVLFIDGDKLRFREDWDAYRPMVRPGGIVFLHDVTDREPRRAWEGICRTDAADLRVDEIIDRTEADEALRRMELNVPSSCPHEAWLRHWRGKSCGVGVVHV